MNERIKALLLNERNMFVNGVTEADNKIYIHGSEENLGKFAELIIKECIGQIKELCDSDGGDVGSEYVEGFEGGMFLAIEKIEDHFGVE